MEQFVILSFSFGSFVEILNVARDMEQLLQLVDKVRVPSKTSKIHKEECLYSFETAVLLYSCGCFDFNSLVQETDDGLFISLTSFLSFSKSFALVHFHKSGEPLYLRIKKTRIQVHSRASTMQVNDLLIISFPGGEDGPRYHSPTTKKTQHTWHR